MRKTKNAAAAATARADVDELVDQVLELDAQLEDAVRRWVASGVTWRQAARHLGVSENALFYSYARGPIPPSVTVDRRRRRLPVTWRRHAAPATP